MILWVFLMVISFKTLPSLWDLLLPVQHILVHSVCSPSAYSKMVRFAFLNTVEEPKIMFRKRHCGNGNIFVEYLQFSLNPKVNSYNTVNPRRKYLLAGLMPIVLTATFTQVFDYFMGIFRILCINCNLLHFSVFFSIIFH